MSRKLLSGLAIAAAVIAVIAIMGWGYSTSWTFRKSEMAA